MRRLLAVLAAGLMVAGVAVAVPTAAQAAEPFSSQYLYGTSSAADGRIYRIDSASGQTALAITAPTTTTMNALALSADGNALIASTATTVFMYDAPSDRWFQTPRPANDAAGMTMGGVNSVNGFYYYGGRDTADSTNRTFRYAAYDLAGNRIIPNALTVTLPGNTGVNGDLVFDQQGNMYILTSDAASGIGSQIWRIDAAAVSTTTGGAATGTPLGTKIPDTQVGVGTAYGADGYGYLVRNLGSGSELLRIDPVSFALVGRVPMRPDTVRVNDLASRAFQPTALVNVDLPEGRHSDTDQFHLSYQGPEPGDPVLEAETTGTETGLQDQESGEYVGRTATFPGDTYTFSQSAAGTTNFGNYRTSWACIDIASGETISSGTGNSGSFTVPVSPILDIDCTFTNVPLRPSLTLEKSADRTELVAGQTTTYSFVVTNTGDVALEIAVNELSFTGSGELSAVTCPRTALAPTEAVTCTATYEVTQADVDRGSVDNAASATGTPPNGGDPVTSAPDEVRVPGVPAPGLSIVKSADRTELVVGETITYEFVVTNTGNVTLSGIAVNEGSFTGSGELSAVDCPVTTLAPDRQVTCTATYEVTQADVDRGSIENSATATGTPPNDGEPVTSEPDDANVPSERNPGIELVKSVSPAEGGAAGDEIVYTFTVRNTGNVTLTEVTVTEGDFSGSGELGPIVCPDAALAPNRTLECTASYVLTQADVDAGGVTNSATATATPPDGTTPPVSPPSSAELPIPPAPGLSIEKSADRAELVVGETITYTFVVTNTGNVTLTDVAVEEGDFSGSGELSAVSCPAEAASLAPGDRVTCTATYEVTQADVDRGSIENSATANGVPPAGGDPVGSEPGEARVPQDPAPGLSLVKSADAERAERPGQLITYSFTISNIGNVTVSDIVVSDDDFSGAGELTAIECPTDPLSLAPGETAVCTATYEVRPGDLDGRPLTNTASASGAGPGGMPVASAPSTVTVPTSAPSSPPPGPGQLSRTGVELGAGILLLVALLLSVGAGTIVVARRKRVDG